MTFTIKQELVGLAIGSRGVNISAPRDLPGISTVELHPQSADASVYEVLINGDDETANPESCLGLLTMSVRQKTVRTTQV